MKGEQMDGRMRPERFERLREETFDVLVIGGGITGCGIALDAASRGMRVALVEMQDFAGGTSSRSTKLIHGGLRYLKQLEVGLVAEVGKERAIVHENGPHVTQPEWMLLPLYRGGTFGPLSTSIGLRIYDRLAGVKRSERRQMLTPEETIGKEPLLRTEGIAGGGYYVEYRTDDARLTIEVAKAAATFGATLVNYAKVTALRFSGKRISGAQVEDVLSGRRIEVRAKVVVNATGPWVDVLRAMAGAGNGKALRLTKGVHLVIDGARFPLRQAVYFDTPDGRMVFAIPRDGKTYVGTTDTFSDGERLNPVMGAADRDYLLTAIRYMFPSVEVGPGDVESSWAGLRPLIYEEGKDPSAISRKDEIWEADSGLLTIAGGKLTGYRKMAELVVDRVAARLKESEGIVFLACRTKTLPVSGGHVGGAAVWPRYFERAIEQLLRTGLVPDEARRLARMYGSNASHIAECAERWSKELSALPQGLYAQVRYAMEDEGACRPLDVIVRRTGDLFFQIERVHTYKEAIIAEMARYYEWTDAQVRAFTEEVDVAFRDASGRG